MESADSASTTTQQPNLPPGFRFHPTDEELVVHYLKRKASSAPLPVAIIADVDLYKFDPWELPAKASFGEQEWYFFSPRDRKYPNGARPNRAATSGYWKATGTDKPVLTSGGTQKVGVKKALVFYGGKPPKGVKTNWIMHEYRLAENKTNVKPPGCDLGSKKNSLRLDDWVLCRIYQKNNTHRSGMDHDRDEQVAIDEMMGFGGMVPPSINVGQMNMRLQLPKLSYASSGAVLLENDQNLMEGLLSNHGGINSSSKSTEQFPPDLVPTLMTNTPKRTLSSLYWNSHEHLDQQDMAGDAGVSGNKRVIGADRVTEETGTTAVAAPNSFATFLSQIPQTPSLHQQLGSVGDGLLRQPYHQLHGMNSWYP